MVVVVVGRVLGVLTLVDLQPLAVTEYDCHKFDRGLHLQGTPLLSSSSLKSFLYFQTMSSRRPSSAASLAKFARTTPVPKSRSNDFCNSFWGVGDGGVDVLFARMRGAARKMEELKNFWKERLDHSCRFQVDLRNAGLRLRRTIQNDLLNSPK